MSLPDISRRGLEQPQNFRPYTLRPELFRIYLRNGELGRDLGGSLFNYIKESHQSGMQVFRHFASNYCPALTSNASSDAASIPRGIDMIDATNKITISAGTLYTAAEFLMGGQNIATMAFLYKALEMTPDTAPEMMRKLLGDKPTSIYHGAMEHVEVAVDLPSGTLDNIF